MTTRTVRVIFEAVHGGLVKGFEQVASAAERSGERVSRATKAVEDHRDAFNDAGKALVAFGGSTLAGLGMSAKAAIDWESAFAGVKKTVDDNAEGYAVLSDELRQMARTLPASHEAIAATAEAAGQLGVAREDITTFTRTMIDLGETTNLTADEAAVAIAQLTNVMGTAGEDVERLGSTIVHLGNNTATTERHIVLMAQRMAGAAAIVGLAEHEVLALAAATASMGIEVEAGGTAVSKVFIDMSKAVSEGGDELALFAQTAGMSADEFATAFLDRPAEAFAAFIQGLGDMQAAGEDVFLTLDDLGLSEVRVSRALLGMASAGDLLTDSLNMGKQAWEDNTALANEAAQRYETTASKLQVMWNNVQDAAISLGEVFLPALQSVSNVVSYVAEGLGSLPEPLRNIIAFGGGAAGVISLLAGGMLLLVPKVYDTVKAFQQLGVIGPRAMSAIQGITGFLMGPWGIAIGVATAALFGWIQAQANAKQAAEELTATLDEQTGAFTEDTRRKIAEAFQFDLAPEDIQRIKDVGVNWREVIDVTIEGGPRMDAFRKKLMDIAATADRDTRKALVGLSSSIENQNEVVQDSIAMWEASQTVLDESASEMLEAIENQQEWNRAIGEGAMTAQQFEVWGKRYAAQAGIIAQETATAAEEVDNFSDSWRKFVNSLSDEEAEALQKYVDELAGIRGSFIDLNGAWKASEDAAKEWAEAQAKATADGKDSWEDFVGKFKGTTEEYLAELERQVESQINWERNLLTLIARGAPQQLIDDLARLGPEGAAQVQLWVDMSDEEFAEGVELYSRRGAESATAFATSMADPNVQRVLRAAAAQLGDAAVEEISNKLLTGEADLQGIIDQYDLVVPVDADAGNAYTILNDLLVEVDASDGTITINGDKTPADTTLGELIGDVDKSDGTVTINGNKFPAEMTLAQLLRLIFNSEEEVTVGADDTVGREDVRGFTQWVGEQGANVKIGVALGSAYSGLWEFIGTVQSQRPVIRVGMNRLAVATGGIIEPRAAGGVDDRGRYVPRRSMIAGPVTGVKNILWAEDPTNWEIYLSGHPAYKAINQGFVQEAARRLGMTIPEPIRAATGRVSDRFTTPITPTPSVTVTGGGGPSAQEIAAALAAELRANPITARGDVKLDTFKVGELIGAAGPGIRTIRRR